MSTSLCNFFFSTEMTISKYRLATIINQEKLQLCICALSTARFLYKKAVDNYPFSYTEADQNNKKQTHMS